MSAAAAAPRSLGRAILVAGAAVGCLDILDAFVFFGIRNHVAPTRILQGIASGAIGRVSFDLGLLSAALGLFFHFLIAFAVAT
ncbi:MAG TPA: hypothetical protein VGR00_08140, partial [Thermoanaerobaculia bacterium]|nr:hypothetical protein [Thermoanaerobaculia bacterium]